MLFSSSPVPWEFSSFLEAQPVRMYLVSSAVSTHAPSHRRQSQLDIAPNDAAASKSEVSPDRQIHTFGVCDLTFPARANDPWTFPILASYAYVGI